MSTETTLQTARMPHRCNRCMRAIHPGEPYMRIFDADGERREVRKLCARCVRSTSDARESRAVAP